MEKNIPLMRKIIEHIETAPETWKQSSWAYVEDPLGLPEASNEVDREVYESWGYEDTVRVADPNLCGTALCIAGHAVNMDTKVVFLVDDTGSASLAQEVATGEVFDIETRARELLGLTANEASMLFDGDNSLNAIKDVVDEFESEWLN
jgi:hypothetical protein